MNITITNTHDKTKGITIFFAFENDAQKRKKNNLDCTHWPSSIKESFSQASSSGHFSGGEGKCFFFQLQNNQSALAVGLGKKRDLTIEKIRRQMARVYHRVKDTHETMTVMTKALPKGSVEALAESLHMSSYKFDRYLGKRNKTLLQTISLQTKEDSSGVKQELKKAAVVTEAINLARDLINDPPNVLNSETYAKLIQKDAEKLKQVQIKILGKPELKKEKMGLFLAVNAGSAYEPRLVHLSYTPSKVTSKTKHIALVGKGLTFDTGGYSLKPGGSMINMKYDMAGSATMYGAFRAAVNLKAKCKISCFLGITDNAVSSKAIMPDSIVKSRSGKTVEILNTDAEGRLVLADVLSYACDQKPTTILDAATLTGAVLISLGKEMGGVMSNNQKLADALLNSAKACDEYLWQLPIIPEFHNDLKAPLADLKNIGSNRFGGTPKAAAFLENFVKKSIPWAHLDIAGVGDSQSHLPYCPEKGPSGIMIRTLVHFILNGKM